MPDHFKDHMNSLTSPASAGAVVVPSDANDLPVYSRAIYVGGPGSLTVELTGMPGQTITLQNVQPGNFYPLRIRKVLASGTSATSIVCLW